MSKKVFSDIEVTKLSKNKNISKVSNKAITYTFEFKKKFIDEYKIGIDLNINEATLFDGI